MVGGFFDPIQWESACLLGKDPETACNAAKCVGATRRMFGLAFGWGALAKLGRQRFLKSVSKDAKIVQEAEDEFTGLKRLDDENLDRMVKWGEKIATQTFPKECLKDTDPELGVFFVELQSGKYDPNKAKKDPSPASSSNGVNDALRGVMSDPSQLAAILRSDSSKAPLIEEVRAMNGTFDPEAVAAKCLKNTDPNNPCQKWECIKKVAIMFMTFLAVERDTENLTEEKDREVQENIDRYNKWRDANVNESNAPQQCWKAPTAPKP